MAEHTLGPANSLLKTGQLTRFELEGKPVVIGRIDDMYYAVAGNCSHYGAPLDKGVLKGTNLICPWHHACFDIRSGERLEPPALNNLWHYPLRIEEGDVIVTLPHDNQTEPPTRTISSDETIVIIGGGAAGNAAAEELCRANYAGKIVIFNAVETVPLDRPNLSKDYCNRPGGANYAAAGRSSWALV
jgi:apoptosis-inducing factor 3